MALHIIDRMGLGLAIAFSQNPIAPKMSGFNVHILDHATAAELRVKYADQSVNLNNIEEVDFVWRGEPLSELIGQDHCYDWIVAKGSPIVYDRTVLSKAMISEMEMAAGCIS